MADLGMDKEGLEMKLMDLEYQIASKQANKLGVAMNIRRSEKTTRDFKDQLVAIDQQIEQHKVDMKSVQQNIDNPPPAE